MTVTRTYGLSELPARGLHINTATAAYTLTADDSGVFFINQYTTNTTYTLPAVALGKGKWFWFMNANTTSTLAITAPANTLCLNDNATATTNTSAADCGSWAMVIGDGTYWYCFEGSGTWTGT